MKSFVGILLTLTAGLILATQTSCRAQGIKSFKPKLVLDSETQTFDPKVFGLSIVGSQVKALNGFDVIIGKVRNTSARDYGMVVLNIIVKENNDECYTYIADAWNVKAHSTGEFKAIDIMTSNKLSEVPPKIDKYDVKIVGILATPATADMAGTPLYYESKQQASINFPIFMAKYQQKIDNSFWPESKLQLIWPYRKHEDEFDLRMPAIKDKEGKYIDMTSGRGHVLAKIIILSMAENIFRLRRQAGYPSSVARDIFVYLDLVGSYWGSDGVSIACVRYDDLPPNPDSETPEQAATRREHFIRSTSFR